MPFYEIMTITTMSTTHQHLITLLNKVNKLVTGSNGVLRSIDHLGLRPLATRMRAHAKYNTIGRYIRLMVQVNPQTHADIISRLNIDTSVVRHMSIKHQTVPQIHPKTPVYLTRTNGADGAVNTHINAVRSTTSLDYYVARAMLSRGILSKMDVVQLPRYQEDAEWLHKSARICKAANIANMEAYNASLAELTAETATKQ